MDDQKDQAMWYAGQIAPDGNYLCMQCGNSLYLANGKPRKLSVCKECGGMTWIKF